jgi:cytochrome P450
MADVVFNRSYDLLGNAKNRYIVDAIAGSSIRTTVLLYLPKLVIGRLDKRLFPASIMARNILLRFISKLVHERLKVSAPKRKDVFSVLQSAKDLNTGKGLQMDEIGAESTTLIIAG